MLEQIAQALEAMADIKIEETAPVQFMNVLRVNLIDRGMPPDLAMYVVSSMDIEITKFDIEDEVWQRIIKAYCKIIMKFYDKYGDILARNIASKLSLKYS